MVNICNYEKESSKISSLLSLDNKHAGVDFGGNKQARAEELNFENSKEISLSTYGKFTVDSEEGILSSDETDQRSEENFSPSPFHKKKNLNKDVMKAW